MNSDDLAKNFAQMYDELATSPSTISGSEKNFKHSENFYIYPIMDAPDEEDDLLPQSFEINFAHDISIYRGRTNTDAKLDKLSDIRKKQSQIKTVKCDDTIVRFNEEMHDDDELFVRKDLSKLSLVPKTSMLSQQLKNLPALPPNKFRLYSRFDGTSHPPQEVRTIQVFIIPFPKEQRDYPLRCCVQATTSVEDFIGFILFKCTQDFPQVSQDTVFGEVTDYGLFISDETGETDLGFPALDYTEKIQKFQFPHLALSKKVSFNFQTRAHSIVSDTTSALNPFNRQSSVESKTKFTSNFMDVHDTMVEAPMYRAYPVIFLSKKRFRTQVQLGISGEKIEIDPLQQKNSTYFFKPVKAIHYSMDSVAWCEISSRKSSRFEFKIAYNPIFFDSASFAPSTSLVEPTTPTSYTLKIHTFETDPTSAEEIVLKVKHILDLRTSSVRREYLNRQDKTKKSFMRKKKFPI